MNAAAAFDVAPAVVVAAANAGAGAAAGRGSSENTGTQFPEILPPAKAGCGLAMSAEGRPLGPR